MNKKRILVIDDFEEIRVLLYEILTDAGYEVTTACDGNEGGRLFRENPVDLVIIDMVMPGKMGIDLIWELTQEFPKVKIIAISAGGDFGPELDLDMAGVFKAHTITKPFNRAQIVEAVKGLTADDATDDLMHARPPETPPLSNHEVCLNSETLPKQTANRQISSCRVSGPPLHTCKEPSS